MPPLEKTGLRAVVENAQAFLRDAANVERAQQKIGESAQKAAKDSRALDTAVKTRQQVLAKFSGVVSKLGPQGAAVAGAMSKVAVAIGAVSAAALIGIGTVAALGAAFLALGARGSSLIGLADSFDQLTASIGVASDKLLIDLRAAAKGTVADFQLMKTANLALAGATGEFGREFGENLPKLLELARVQARATGQDVDYLFNSLITGIKRGSPLLIDNTGLVLKVSEANQQYADSVGKTVEQLTQEEKQIALLNATLAAGEVAIQNLGNAQETAADKTARANAIITNTLDTLAVAVQPAYEAVLDLVNGILSSVQSLVTQFAPYIAAIAQQIGELIGGIKLTLGVSDTLAKDLFTGAARAFGAFAQGIMAAANQHIFPTIIDIAEFVRDFLMGLSPPKKGPLSTIDKGGENIMKAWLEGVTGVSLDPVEKVAAQVDAALGSIGKFSRKQVETRLAQLDAALAPFQHRLEIIRSEFEAIADPAKKAIEAIDRQLDTALNALGSGDERAAEVVRSLDRQREAVQGFVDAQQAVVDQAQIQLALATAQQARERTLLNIRKAMLGPLEKVNKKEKERSAKAKVPKEKKLKGEAPAPESATGGATPLAPGTNDVLSAIGLGEDQVAAARQDLELAFSGQIDARTQVQFNANRRRLGQLGVTIGNIDVGGKLADKFKPIADIFDPEVEGSVANRIVTLFNNLFGAENPTSIPNLLSNIDIAAGLAQAQTNLSTFFNNLFDPAVAGSPANIVAGLIDGLLNPETEGSIPNRFARLGVDMINTGVELRGEIEQVIRNIFDPERETSITYKALDFIDSIINPEREGSIPAFFADLGGHIQTAVSGLSAAVQTSVIDPIKAFLTGEGAAEGALTLPGIINQAVDLFAGLPGRITEVLRGLGAAAYTAVVVPVIQAINGLIGAVESALKGILEFVSNTLGDLQNTLADTGVVPDAVISAIGNIKAGLKNQALTLRLSRISTDLPDFLQSVQAQPAAFSAGNVSVDNSNTTINATFNGIPNADSAMQRFARMSAV